MGRTASAVRERSRRRIRHCDIVEMGTGPTADEPSYIEIRGRNNEAVCTIFPHAGNGGVGTKMARAIAEIIAGAFAASPGRDTHGEGISEQEGVRNRSSESHKEESDT